MSQLCRDCVGLLALLLVLPAAGFGQTRHFPSDEELGTTVRYLVEDTPVAGIVLGLLEADGSTRVVSHGTAGDGARPLGPNSVFEIGSITKTFTGALLADAVQRGLMSLDDPVQMYLPDSVRVPQRGGRSITLQHLAMHHSGLPRLASNHEPAQPSDPYADYTLATMYSFLATHELRRDPGAAYEYSNLGFQLLGHAIARASGSSLTDLVRSRILDPVGMSATGYDLEGDFTEWMARGHRALAPTPPHTGGEARRGAGGLRSNVIDMLMYLRANVGPPRNGLERAMREAQAPRSDFGARGSTVGLAWVATTVGERRIVQHGGGTGGFTSRIAFDPDHNVGYVLLTNSRLFSDPTTNELLLLGPPLDFPEVSVASERLSSLAGVYRIGDDERLYLRHEPEGYLTAQFNGRTRAKLHARSDTSFFMKSAPVALTVVREPDRPVSRLIVERRGLEPAIAVRTANMMPDPQTVRAGAVWSSLGIQWPAMNTLAGIATLAMALLALLVLGFGRRRR